MNNVEFRDIEFMGISATYAFITHDDGSQTSMLKADYDAQQAASTLPSESSIPTTPQAGA
jgi:hypothetical protein